MRLFGRKPANGNGSAARKAADESGRKLRDAQCGWPQTREAHDKLAEMIEQALRGYR